MARIYQQQQYGDQFQPRQQSRGFNPVQAIDATSKEKQKAQQALRDVETEMKATARQQTLDRGHLQAQHGIQRANMQASQATMRGILQLSQTALKGAQMYNEHQAREAETDEVLSAMGFGGDDQIGVAPESDAKTVEIDAQVLAEGAAITEIAGQLQAEGTLEGDDVANQLQQGSAYQSLKGINGNLLNARGAHGAFLEEAISNLPPDMKPKTLPEAQALIHQLNRKFFAASGLSGGDRHRIASKLGPTVIDNSSRMASALVKSAIKEQQQANSTQLDSDIYNAVKGGASAEELWGLASQGAAFGNIGNNGRSAISNEEAIDKTLEALILNRDASGIIALGKADKVPGNPGAGTLNDAYGHKIEKALQEARTGVVQEWNQGKSERKMVAEQMLRDYHENPGSIDRADLVRHLRRLGPTGRTEADKILSAGLNNDPELELDIAARAAAGNPYGEYELQDYYDRGLIRESVYKEQLKRSQGAQITKEVDSAISGSEAQIRAGMTAQIDSKLLSAAQKVELNTRAGIFAADLAQRLQSEAKAAGVVDNPLELEKMKADIMNKMLAEPQYHFTSPTLGEVTWGSPIDQTTQFHQDITVSPGQQDIRKFTPEEIMGQRIIPRTELSHIDDNILTQADTLAAARITDGNYSPRIEKLAKYMGLSPKALVEGQLQRYNQPSLQALKESGEITNVQDVGDTTDFGKATGYAYIRNNLDFPARGAAYLTSAIDHESTWHGTREWGQVAGDGTNRNGGLISWASWANNSARLGAIERHFGTNIANIPERDQLNYMKMEMQRSYPDAYQVFMNPNASSADLQWAVSRYWGFDPKYTGSRWTDAEQYIQNPPLQYTR